MPESSFPVFFPAGFALSGWKTPCKTAQGGGSRSGCGVTGVTSLPAAWYSRGNSLQSRLFPARSWAYSRLVSALAPQQQRLGEGSGTGSRGIKADIVGMSSRCSERICRRLAEAAGGTSPWKGLFVPTC